MQVRMYLSSYIETDPKPWQGIKDGPPLSPLHVQPILVLFRAFAYHVVFTGMHSKIDSREGHGVGGTWS
jgi:hypothetical protein